MPAALPKENRAVATEDCSTGECAPARGRKRSVLTLTLLCAHCSLTLLVPVLALVLTLSGAYLGLPLVWVMPPFLLAGAFLFLIWPGIKDSWARLRSRSPSMNPQEPQG